MLAYVTQGSPLGIVAVSPPKQHVAVSELRKGVGGIEITNTSGVPQKYELALRKVIPGSTGASDIQDDAPDAGLHLDTKSVQLSSGSRAMVHVEVDELRDASKEIYAAVMVTPESQVGNGVAVTSALASILVITPDELQPVLRSSLSLKQRWPWQVPEQLEIATNNQGAASGTLRGSVQLEDSEGQVLGSEILNPDSELVRPGSSYRQMLSVQKHRLTKPGKYRVVLTSREDAEQPPQVTSSSFWYVPSWYLLLVSSLPLGALLYWLIRLGKPRRGV